jgi:hypothetical protein
MVGQGVTGARRSMDTKNLTNWARWCFGFWFSCNGERAYWNPRVYFLGGMLGSWSMGNGYSG